MPDTSQAQKGKIPIGMLGDSFVILTASDSCGYNKQGIPDSKKQPSTHLVPIDIISKMFQTLKKQPSSHLVPVDIISKVFQTLKKGPPRI
jgi:hypothetical protein